MPTTTTPAAKAAKATTAKATKAKAPTATTPNVSDEPTVTTDEARKVMDELAGAKTSAEKLDILEGKAPLADPRAAATRSAAKAPKATTAKATTTKKARALKVVETVEELPAAAVSAKPAKAKAGKDEKAIASATAPLATACALHVEAVNAERTARANRAKAMIAAYDAGMSYAQIAELVGMTPMSARAAILAAR